MSTENIAKFREMVASQPDLAAKINSLPPQSLPDLAATMAELSVEVQTPFTAEELLAKLSESNAELSDEALEQVAGGTDYSHMRTILIPCIPGMGVGR